MILIITIKQPMKALKNYQINSCPPKVKIIKL